MFGRTSFVVLALFISVGPIRCAPEFEIVQIARLPSPRGYASSVYDGADSVYIAGGLNGLQGLSDVLRYNISTSSIEHHTDLPHSLESGAMGWDGIGTFSFFGGRYEGWSQDDIYAFSANEEGVASRVGELPRNLSYTSAASDANGSIYVMSGQGYPEPSEIYKYDTITHQVDVAGHMPRGLQGVASVWHGDSVYIFGGRTSTLSLEIVKFTPATGEVRILGAELSYGAMYASAVVVDHHIYLIGGMNNRHNFQFRRLNTITEQLEPLWVTNYSVELLTPCAVYVPQESRIYVFGGAKQTEWGGEFDEIFYIQL